MRKLAISRVGCGDFLIPLRYASVAVHQSTTSSASLADIRKLSATRAGDILEMGSPFYCNKIYFYLQKRPQAIFVCGCASLLCDGARSGVLLCGADLVKMACDLLPYVGTRERHFLKKSVAAALPVQDELEIGSLLEKCGFLVRFERSHVHLAPGGGFHARKKIFGCPLLVLP